MNVRERVEAAIENQTGTDVDLDERLRSFDWIDTIQLAVDLEEEFGVSVSDRELEQRESVEEISEYIESLVTTEGV